MESSRYLCAIKVLYTGRATFEIKGADRTSVSREAKNGPFSLCPSLFSPVMYVSRSLLRSLSALAYSLSIYDRFTYNRAGDKKTKRKGSVADQGEIKREISFAGTYHSRSFIRR